jgi:hypothetical protein
MAGRHIRFWFFVAGAALSILCIPAGIIASKVEMSSETCSGQHPCFSIQEVYWWFNGLLGLVTCFALVALTLTVESVLGLVRRT